MIDFIYDTFRLYLSKNHCYVKRYIVSNREKAYELVNNLQDEYDSYLLIGHINLTNEDVILEHNDIEHTDYKTRTRRKGR